MDRRRFLALALPTMLAAGAAAQGFPARPVRLMVPFPPGGNSELLARLLADGLASELGQPVLLDHRPGAGGTIGAEAVANSPPDGHTLLLSNNLSIATAPLIYPRPGYRPLEDFAHLFLIGSIANAFMVRVEHPAQSFASFIARARANPGKLTFGSSGSGSAGHLTGVLLLRLAGIDLVHVPYRGAGQALVDLLAGRIDAMFNGTPTAAALARAGRVRLLAVSSRQRVPVLANVPAMDEVVPGAVGVAWFGVSAPARTPPEVRNAIEREGLQALALPAVRAKLAEMGVLAAGLRSVEYAHFIEAEIRKWTPVVRESGVKPE